jgi:ketosteroid isomerase-like protein
MKSKAEEALELGKRLIDCLGRRDMDSIIPLLHENIVLEVVFPFVKGEDTVGARFQRGKAVHDYLNHAKQHTSQILFKNVVWRTTNDGWAIFQADAGNVLADGTPYPQSYLFMFESTSGKIARWVEYMNPICAVRALGAPLESLPYAS